MPIASAFRLLARRPGNQTISGGAGGRVSITAAYLVTPFRRDEIAQVLGAFNQSPPPFARYRPGNLGLKGRSRQQGYNGNANDTISFAAR
jgi:hypothetical protein